MSVKIAGPGASPDVFRFDGGFTWIAHPEEGMQRASHALETDQGVWLVDPVDAEPLDGHLEEYDDVAGVLVLLDRHGRDAARLARRHDVAVFRPPGITRTFDVPTEDLTDGLPGSEYAFLTVQDWPGWHEVALWNGATLVVPESLGTNAFSRAGDERIGLNPVARLAPPRHLGEYTPARLLVGHGPPVLEDPGPAMADALSNARRRLPQAWFDMARSMLGS